ncbi:MAG: DUF2254 domain-containing protein [Nakamurella sp.]
MTARSRVEDIRDAVRTQLWPAPTAGILLAVLAGVLLPELDRAIDDLLPDSVTGYLFGGGASAARTVLDAVASSLITVTSLTFSLTVVTLQLASGQFSPRLLRTFTRDRFVHVTLALFLATFVYALTVLRTVRSTDEQQDQFVPQISVTVAFVLAVASVVALVLFLAHLAREIRVETMLAGVHRDATSTVTRLFSDTAGSPGTHQVQDPPPVPPSGATSFLADESGFLTGIDRVGLCRTACEYDAVVRVDRFPGEFVVAGTPVGRYWWEGEIPDRERRAEFVDSLAGGVTIGMERTDTQDFTFGLRQLTDVTSKALSPGVNDPTTAIHSLGHTSALLCEIARHDLVDELIRDDDGQLRVICRRTDFARLLDEALTQPRRYGAADPAVVTRLFTLLREVGWSVHADEQRQAVLGQLERLQQTVAAQDFDAVERGGFDACERDVREALQGTWSG